MKNELGASKEDVRDVLTVVFDMGIERAFMSKKEKEAELAKHINKMLFGKEEDEEDESDS